MTGFVIVQKTKFGGGEPYVAELVKQTPKTITVRRWDGLSWTEMLRKAEHRYRVFSTRAGAEADLEKRLKKHGVIRAQQKAKKLRAEYDAASKQVMQALADLRAAGPWEEN